MIPCDFDRGAPRLLPGRDKRWGVGGPSGPPSPATLIEARHGFCRGAPSDGGFGGHLGAPIKMDDFEAWFDKGVTDGLPVVPPTRARVEAMLAATRRARHELLGEIPPHYGR